MGTEASAQQTDVTQPAVTKTDAGTTAPEQQKQQATDDAATKAATGTTTKVEGAEGDKGKAEGDGEGTKVGAPEAYTDFALPEGVALDDEVMREFTGLAKEHNLTQEAAQKFVALGAKMSQKSATSLQDGVAQMRDGWLADSKADKEFGGEAYEANVAQARTVFQQFGTPELAEFLNASGIGNHPEMIRWAHRVSKAITPGKTITGRQTDGKVTDARKFYPNSPQLTA